MQTGRGGGHELGYGVQRGNPYGETPTRGQTADEIRRRREGVSLNEKVVPTDRPHISRASPAMDPIEIPATPVRRDLDNPELRDAAKESVALYFSVTVNEAGLSLDACRIIAKEGAEQIVRDALGLRPEDDIPELERAAGDAALRTIFETPLGTTT